MKFTLGDIVDITILTDNKQLTYNRCIRVYNIQRDVTPTLLCISVATLDDVDRSSRFCNLVQWCAEVRRWALDYYGEACSRNALVSSVWADVCMPGYCGAETCAAVPLPAHLHIFPENLHGVNAGSMPQHTYLVQVSPWSARRWAQAEAFPLHSGWADACDSPKCGLLGHVIFKCGGLRSR